MKKVTYLFGFSNRSIPLPAVLSGSAAESPLKNHHNLKIILLLSMFLWSLFGSLVHPNILLLLYQMAEQ